MKIPVPTKSQAEVIAAYNLVPMMYMVLQDYESAILVRHISSGEVKYLEKEKEGKYAKLQRF